ncbi:2-octaprenyl-6-methoxyphenyl hydroxylase [uncultured Abyssibacter sp.]|uniref:2-octaprenyl-6-methoxyphenyl hydroxylase n=1 Tax=uncultured Abyssibacter sp. TaxID=2320202 RepID=UPI0032B2270C
MSDQYDVIIAGGGMVGASLAVALADLPLRIAVIEPLPLGSDDQPSFDERTIALNAASRVIFNTLGVWSAMADEAAEMRSIHISDQGRFGITRIRAADYGLSGLGDVIPTRTVGRALFERITPAERIDFICPARVASLDLDDPDAAAVTLDDGRRLTARLLVGADGARSQVRAAMGIDAEMHDYQAKAIVSSVAASRPIDGQAFERFTADGPIALLPGPHDRCVLVWTRPTDVADALVELDEAAFLDQLNAGFGRRLGRLHSLGGRQAYPLYRVMATRLAGPRSVLIGNAANNLHPVAGQGFNLGLRDAATLAEILADALAAGGDIGAGDVLSAYARRRETDRRAVAGMTHGLIQVFSNHTPGLRTGRNLGLLTTDLLPGLKRRMAIRSTGFAGQPPRLARGLPVTAVEPGERMVS